VRECPRCEGWIEERFRFCPWCAAPQRAKLVEFFTGTQQRYAAQHEQGSEQRTKNGAAGLMGLGLVFHKGMSSG
jgi:hypothetical protein